MLNARNMAETIIGHIKEFSSLNLSKPRSVINAFVHIIAAITAYQINPFKPKLNLQSRYQLETTALEILIRVKSDITIFRPRRTQIRRYRPVMSAKPFTAEMQRLGLPLRHGTHVEPEIPAPALAVVPPAVFPGAIGRVHGGDRQDRAAA